MEAVVAVLELACMRRGDGKEMKRRAGLSQTYGFWTLATRPVLDSFGKTSRSHKGASRPVFLLLVTFSEAIQGIGWSFQRHTIHEVGHKDLEAAFLPTELPVLKAYAQGTFRRRWLQCITSA